MTVTGRTQQPAVAPSVGEVQRTEATAPAGDAAAAARPALVVPDRNVGLVSRASPGAFDVRTGLREFFDAKFRGNGKAKAAAIAFITSRAKSPLSGFALTGPAEGEKGPFAIAIGEALAKREPFSIGLYAYRTAANIL